MRPHYLQLTAFGPFAGTVEVDLDALAANGLFLLRGETGAGKTTLLDGLGFALYGRVPGVRNGAKRLRSDLRPARGHSRWQAAADHAFTPAGTAQEPWGGHDDRAGQGAARGADRQRLDQAVDPHR